MKVLDLFSGIGGFSLGLERAGMQTVAFCEINPFCRKVLAKHWPNIPIYEDVKTLTADRLKADGISVDVICGGFPCQDVSHAGRRIGIDGEKSGLWSEYSRIIGEVRPSIVAVENVAALLGRGLERVLRDVAALGYDAEWHCIPAAAVGAPHLRDRIWILAYPNKSRLEGTAGERDQTGSGRNNGVCIQKPSWRDTISNSYAPRYGERIRRAISNRNQWPVEPDVGRVANGVPNRVDRIAALGNAVVPQIPEIIGRAIMAAEEK